MILKRIHYLSGLILTIFIGAHLFNHTMSLFGVGTHVLIMDKLRVVYRHPAVESILLLAVLLQLSYNAKTSTTLLPGFEVMKNGELEVRTDGCPND